MKNIYVKLARLWRARIYDFYISPIDLGLIFNGISKEIEDAEFIVYHRIPYTVYHNWYVTQIHKINFKEWYETNY